MDTLAHYFMHLRF